MDGLGLTRMHDHDETKIERAIGSYTSQETAYAINARYATSAKDGGIHVQNLDSQTHSFFSLGNSTIRNPVLAFSCAKLNLLAAANGAHILIYDAEAQRVCCVLKGVGHIITAICYSSSDYSRVASGSVNGSVCIWSLANPTRPTYQLQCSAGPCTRIALHPNDPHVVAVCSRDCISVWVLPALRPKAILQLDGHTAELLSWCPNNNGRILITSRGGRLIVCNMRHILDSKSPQLGIGDEPMDSDDDNDNMFGELEGMKRPLSILFDFPHTAKQSRLLGHHGIVVLPYSSRTIYFYSYSFDANEPTELWRLNVGAGVRCFALRTCKASVEAIAFFKDGHQAFDVPTPVLDGIGWTYGRSLQWLPVLEPGPLDARSETYSNMLPRKLSSRLRPKRRRQRPQDNVKEVKSEYISRVKKQKKKPSLDEILNVQIAQKSLTASLELPRIAATEDESPMPFLSPSIPARKVSPGPITPLDEIVQLPPQAIFDTMSLAATQGHDSDSDDETFAPHMQGSGTLLPGGINVPLPRTCGASFGPNGQLATFFLIRTKVATLLDDIGNGTKEPAELHSQEVTNLFPTFGNLGSSNPNLDDADLNSVGSVNGTPGMPKFIIQAASFDSRPSWSAKISPVKPESGALPGQQSVNVTIRDLETFTPTRRVLAESYQHLSQGDLSDNEMCSANAICAEAEGLEETAHAWRLLGLILERKDMMRSGLDGPESVLSIRPKASRNPSMMSYNSEISVQAGGTIVLSALDPFGGTWALEQVFAWAEARADIQLLANMSCFLNRRSLTSVSSNFGGEMTAYATYFNGTALQTNSRSTYGVPLLRADSSALRPQSDSLVKPRISRASSGNPSQPTTPYLDSSASTPPMTLPPLSRQGSVGLSIAGSVSPEHHRSSFSTAARNYAASIAEKFGSYGSSPPNKKMGNSPGHELPSSLPSGSLSKSVSFASGINGSSTRTASLSLAQEDDNYDSDRTIEDGSLPHTPKGVSSTVSFKSKQGHFFDETSTNASAHGLPVDLAIKCGIWRQHYAELLRSWDLVLLAAEMENITNREPRSRPRSKSPGSAAVLPANTTNKRTTCTICFCVILAAQQICPDCLHTTHPACLEDFISASADMEFACPAGCGCSCSSTKEVYFTIDENESTPVVQPSRPPFARKPSITDPLRLRQRLQGESW